MQPYSEQAGSSTVHPCPPCGFLSMWLSLWVPIFGMTQSKGQYFAGQSWGGLWGGPAWLNCISRLSCHHVSTVKCAHLESSNSSNVPITTCLRHHQRLPGLLPEPANCSVSSPATSPVYFHIRSPYPCKAFKKPEYLSSHPGQHTCHTLLPLCQPPFCPFVLSWLRQCPADCSNDKQERCQLSRAVVNTQ